ncbi:tRNA guanosine(34) transglycosylase Tgt [Candidatus Pacearchaeota archaeon]|nr:tRNA guanosine(34) transglycosylase Tgt [Candidatus Pacearchaeota archaeon]
MNNLKFTITAQDGKARTGVIEINGKSVETPEFMSVATRAEVKTLSLDELNELNVRMIICNTYHLMLEPGADVVKKKGGLHKFMGGFKGIVATDSGGFQAFSLGAGKEFGTNKLYFPKKEDYKEFRKTPKLSKKDFERKRQNSRLFKVLYKNKKKKQESFADITDNGVKFKSVYDDSLQFLSPEKSIEVQEKLGADIILVLDECTSPLHSKKYNEKSLKRTHDWAKRCLSARKTKQALVGIVQGSEWKDLRERSAKFIASLPFDSYAIGGALGKSKKEMYEIISWVVPHLKGGKPIHLLGVGTVEDLFECVERGIDLFDCVTPTRMARFGYAYVSPPFGNKKNKFRYKINLKNSGSNEKPIDKNCNCKICKNYAQEELYNLKLRDKKLAHKFFTYHNVYFFLDLMRLIREAIRGGKFEELKRKWGI